MLTGSAKCTRPSVASALRISTTGLMARPTSLNVSVGRAACTSRSDRRRPGRARKRRRRDTIERHRRAHVHPIGHPNRAAQHRHVRLRHPLETPIARADAGRPVAFAEGSRIVKPGAELRVGRDRWRCGAVDVLVVVGVVARGAFGRPLPCARAGEGAQRATAAMSTPAIRGSLNAGTDNVTTSSSCRRSWCRSS